MGEPFVGGGRLEIARHSRQRVRSERDFDYFS